jgi:hypothetical protein
MVPTTSSSRPIGTRGVASSAWSCSSTQARPACDRGPGAAGLLDDQEVHRPAARLDRLDQALAVELLAAQRDQEHRADVRVGGERVHHVLGVAVRVAAAEADQVDALVLERHGDGAGHVVRALDQIGDQHDVPDALAAVGARIGHDGGVAHASPSKKSSALTM